MYQDNLKDTASGFGQCCVLHITQYTHFIVIEARLWMRSVMRIPSGSDHQITYYQLDV